MRTSYYFILLFLVSIYSCNSHDGDGQSDFSKLKLDSLHRFYNEQELEKVNIQLSKDTTTIVAFGHVYGLLYHEDVFDSLIALSNAQHPDYVWILGDVVFNNTEEEWSYLLDKYQGFEGQRFHAGGNHDMNYHYERYHGINENQWEAESRFLSKIGYRYLTVEDDNANYMLINMNDSLSRILNYLDLMEDKINPEKPSILFTHHATWHDNQSIASDPKTWVKKSFPRESLLVNLGKFDYLIHGDWGERFYFGKRKINKVNYNLIAAGNLNEGDSLRITLIKISHDSLWAEPIFVPIDTASTWYTKKARN